MSRRIPSAVHCAGLRVAPASCAALYGVAFGSLTEIVIPPLRSASARISPWWALATEVTMDSPRPTPWPLLIRPPRRVKGSNKDATADSGTSGPVLVTVMYDSPLSLPVTTLSRPPGTL